MNRSGRGDAVSLSDLDLPHHKNEQNHKPDKKPQWIVVIKKNHERKRRDQLDILFLKNE
jgi:hypothetical protein